MLYSCVVTTCDSPPADVSLKTINPDHNFTYGMVVEYECADGYSSMSGLPQVTCQASGDWSNLTAFCNGRLCGKGDS